LSSAERFWRWLHAAGCDRVSVFNMDRLDVSSGSPPERMPPMNNSLESRALAWLEGGKV
jgi:hypothetical protein